MRSDTSNPKPVRVLFVCLGNICRSPAAEGVLRSIIEPEMQEKVLIDSAGTAGWHQGKAPDSRMCVAARKRGIHLDSLRARQVHVGDFDDFDLLIAMDESNHQHLWQMARGEEDRRKLRRFLDYTQNHTHLEGVPDPYYGGLDGFEEVLDILSEGCEALYHQIISKKGI